MTRSATDPQVKQGETVRRAMFGDDLVDRNYVAANDFQRPVQEWLASAVWADVWTREGIDRRTRSLVTIGMLAALKSPELEMHIAAATKNGCSVEEIQETLLHAAPYCGAPAALSAFRVAERVLARLGALDPADANTSQEGAEDGLRHE